MKKCYCCKNTKPFIDFYKNKAKKDGYRSECKDCHKAASLKWAKEHPEKHNKQNKDWVNNNPEKRQETLKKWRQQNPEAVKLWKSVNGDRVAAYTAYRRAAQIQATPPWVERDLIKIVYTKAKELGSHVDHIVPLNSDKVCGLHCWANLQILPSELNAIKSNRNWPDMP